MKTTIQELEDAMCDAWGSDSVSENVGSQLSVLKDEFNKKQWISVKEYLPPKTGVMLSDAVLVVHEDGSMEVANYDYDVNGWLRANMWQNVTHWMRLPNKPI